MSLLIPTRLMLRDQTNLDPEGATIIALNTLSELPHVSHRWGMFEKLPVLFRIPSYTDDQGKEIVATDFVKTPSPGYKRSRVNLMSTLALNYVRQLCYDKPLDKTMNMTIYAVTDATSDLSSDWDHYPYKLFIDDVCQDEGR